MSGIVKDRRHVILHLAYAEAAQDHRGLFRLRSFRGSGHPFSNKTHVQMRPVSECRKRFITCFDIHIDIEKLLNNIPRQMTR